MTRSLRQMLACAAMLAGALALGGCELIEGESYEWDLPEGFPEPRVPEENPMSEAKVELGRFLFYDPRVSGNEEQSCASCHDQSLAFTDGLEVSRGSTGDFTPRSSMPLANAAYHPRYTWANNVLFTLEDQALVPMFGEDPVELGTHTEVMLERLRDDPMYPPMFADAFDDEEPITLNNVVRAIASFERSMISGSSPYDRYVAGDTSAISESAIRGIELFNSERFECFHCHGGFNFTDGVTHTGTVLEEVGFHNTGLYNIDGRGGYPEPNRGIYEQTGDPRDMGRFRSPSLRNVAVTAPYMHDGSIATLDGVIDHYAAGGRTITEGPNAGVGSESMLKNIFIHGFDATEQEREDLLSFLRSLTDDEFMNDPRFSDPFE